MAARALSHPGSSERGRFDVRPVVDRIVVILLLLGLITAAVIVFLVSIGVVGPGLVGNAAYLRPTLDRAAGAGGAERFGWVALSGLVTLLLAAALVRRLIPRRKRPPRRHLLASDEKGVVMVETRGVVAVVKRAASSVPGVVTTDADVHGSGSSPVRLHVRVGTYPGSDLAQIGQAARTAVTDAMTQLVGIPVQDVTVEMELVDPERTVRELT